MKTVRMLTLWITLHCQVTQFAGVHTFLDRLADKTCLQRSVDRLIKELKWTSITVIHDTFEVVDIPQSVKQQRYNIDFIDTGSILQSIHATSFPDINIIIALNDTWTQRIVAEIDKYDLLSNGTTDYRHHSKIVLIMKNVHELPGIEQGIQHLENVAAYVVQDICENTMELYTMSIYPTRRAFTALMVTEHSSLLNRVFPNIKYGYNNRCIAITTLESDQYVIKKMINGTVTYAGYMFDIWKTVAKILNISYVVKEPDDMDWGKVLDNGQWSGMIRQLNRKEVDLAVADLTVTYERAECVDFIFPSVMVDAVDIIYRRQLSPLKQFFLLVRPLRNDVYIAFVIACVSTVIVFFVVEHRRCLNMSMPNSREQLLAISIQLFNIFGEFTRTIFKQDLKLNPSTYAGKVLLSSWCLLVLIFTSLYCGNLIASLSTQSDLSKLTSIDQLVDSDYKVGIVRAGLFYDTIKISDRPELQRLNAKILQLSKYDPRIYDPNEQAHFTRVKNEMYAYVTYTSTAERLMTEDCNLAVIGEPVTWASESLSFALPKGSPLKTDIEKTMVSLQESGILDAWWKKWNPAADITNCSVDRPATAITMRDVAGGLYVVCASLGLSVFVLGIEICRKWQNCDIFNNRKK